MNEPRSGVRPETRTLDALIKATIARVEASTGSGPADTVLFLGNRHQAFPSAVVKDPVLEPVGQARVDGHPPCARRDRGQHRLPEL